MQQVFYTGHGYENPTMGDRQPCTVFNGYEILANPLGGFSNADRERRVFPTGWHDTKVTYGSHALKLGRLPSTGTKARAAGLAARWPL